METHAKRSTSPHTQLRVSELGRQGGFPETDWGFVRLPRSYGLGGLSTHRDACEQSEYLGLGDNYRVATNRRRVQLIAMLITRITGSQIHAGRIMAGLTREDLATASDVSRHSVRKWECSSNALPHATLDHLCRVVTVLEEAGVRFLKNNGVRLEQRYPTGVSVTVPSEAIV